MTYKKSGLFALLVLCLYPSVTTLHAQNAEDRLAAYKANKFIQQFSIVAGPSINFLRGNDAVDDGPLNERKNLVGYSFGVQIGTRNIIDKFSFSAGLLSERKGGKSLSKVQYFDQVDQTMKLGQIEDKYKYDYYTMQVRILYSVDKKEKLRIGLGGYFGYLRKQIKEINRLYNPSNNSIEDETEFNSKTDYGLSASFSYRIADLKPFSIDLSLMNNLGLQNIRPDNLSSTMKTNSTLFIVGLTF